MKTTRKQRQEASKLDARNYIQYHLDLYGLGKLVQVKGPKRGGKNSDQGWFECTIVYRPPGLEGVKDVQFYDKYIDVYLGRSRSFTYWNRRQIRVAIAAEGRERREEAMSEQVWKRAQLAITAGPGRTEDGAFAL